MINSLNKQRVDGSGYQNPDNIIAVKVRDESVNHGRVLLKGNSIELINMIATNTAGNFNGGGVGNKSIACLNFGQDNELLSEMPTMEYLAQLPVGQVFGGTTAYMNTFVDLLGDGTDIRVMSYMFMGSTAPLDNTGIRTDLGNNLYHISFDKSVNDVAFVNLPLAGVVPVVGTDLVNWTQRRYNIDDVVAVYPNAKFFHGLSGDGGMPKYVKTCSFVLCNGDSTTNTRMSLEISEMKINGLDAKFRDY